MVKLGDVALKMAGRDAGHICAVVEIMDENYVLIEGNVRRRKCNLLHLEFLNKNVDVKKGDTKKNVLDGLKKSGFKFKEVNAGEKKEKKVQEKKREKKHIERIDKKKSRLEDIKKKKDNEKEIKK